MNCVHGSQFAVVHDSYLELTNERVKNKSGSPCERFNYPLETGTGPAGSCARSKHFCKKGVWQRDLKSKLRPNRGVPRLHKFLFVPSLCGITEPDRLGAIRSWVQILHYAAN